MNENRTTHPGTTGLSTTLGASDPRLRRSQAAVAASDARLTRAAAELEARDAARIAAVGRLRGRTLDASATLAEVIEAHNALLRALTEET